MPNPTAIPLSWQIGQIIDDLYKVEDKFSGGMGEVYKVQHLKWDLPLAVKTPLPELVRDLHSMRRFIKEAETWVNLGLHPNITSCYYVRELGGLPRIFIEYIDGGSLREKISCDSKMELKEILDIGIQLSRGMGYVHEQGIIHRDLKPANCLISKEGIVKITDFGIAKVGEEILMDTYRRRVSEAFEGTMTMTGSGFGTPEYMSPEQFEDTKHVGKESDIYAFGAMLFEMITRKKPFQMPKSMHPAAREEYYRRAHHDRVVDDARLLNKDCPLVLNDLIFKCLSKSPKRRYGSFGEVEKILLKEYNALTGKQYFREEPDIQKLKAASLNNRALSMLDLKRTGEAERCWEEALQNDPVHMETKFNQGYYLWKRGKTDPEQYFISLKAMSIVHGGDPEYWRHLIMVALDIGLVEYAKDALENAESLGCDIDKNLIEEIKDNEAKRIVFQPHIGKIDAAAFSPNGKYVLVGSEHKLSLWDVATGVYVRVFEEYFEGTITSLAFSLDGEYVLTCCRFSGEKKGDDNTLKLSKVNTGELYRLFKGHTERVTSVAFCPTGKYALSGSSDKTMRLWDIVTGECVKIFEGHEKPVNRIAFSPDGGHILSVSSDAIHSTLRLWSAETCKCVRVFEGAVVWILSVAFSPTGEYVLSGGADNTLRLWDVETGKCMRVFRHETAVNSMAITPNGRYVLSGNTNGNLRFWDIKTGRCLRVFRCRPGSKEFVQMSYSAAFNLDDNYVLSLYDAGILMRPLIRWKNKFTYINSKPLVKEDDVKERKIENYIYSVEKLIKLKMYSRAYSLIRKIRAVKHYSRDQLILDLVESCAKHATKKHYQEHWILRSFKAHKYHAAVYSVAFSPNGEYVATGTNMLTLSLWDIESGKFLRKFEGHKAGIVTSAVFSPDGKYVLTGNSDNILRLWEAETGECLRAFEGHTAKITSVAFSPDGKYGLSGSSDKSMRLWDIATGECVRVLDHVVEVNLIVFSPNGKYVLSGADVFLCLWDISTGACLRVFEENTAKITSVAFSPDVKYGLSGNSDKTVRLWDIATGKYFSDSVRAFEGHTAKITTVAFSPDGKYVLSGSSDKTLRLWDVSTGECIGIFEGHAYPVISVAFSPKDNCVISVSTEGRVNLWYIDWAYEFKN